MSPADLLFINGAVYTVDARSWATALAVVGDRITYVGTDATAPQLVGPHTRLIDLDHRMLPVRRAVPDLDAARGGGRPGVGLGLGGHRRLATRRSLLGEWSDRLACACIPLGQKLVFPVHAQSGGFSARTAEEYGASN